MKVLGISGSLRRDSHNTKLLHLPLGCSSATAWSSRSTRSAAAAPVRRGRDREPAPAAVAELRAAVASADAVFFATPEYNHSIPGQLKNAVDWLSRPAGSGALMGKYVAVVGASAGMFGAVWAQAELRKVLAAAGSRVVEGEVPIGHAHTRFDEDGRLNAPELAEQVDAVVQALIAAVEPEAAELAA